MADLESESIDEIETEEDLPEDFDIQENEDGSATVIPKQSDKLEENTKDFLDNLAIELNNTQEGAQFLSNLATDFLQFIEIDKKAREKRDKQYAEAIRRTGLGDDAPGGAEFEGASKVVHPMIAECAIEFNSTAIKELCPPSGPVRTNVIGRVTPEKLQKADRKQRHMNWQFKNQIVEFKSCLEQTLTQASVSGVQYTKQYYWARGRRSKFEYVPMDDVYVPYHAPNFYAATRKTHRQRLTRIEFEERVASGLYLDDVALDMTDAMNFMESEAQKASDRVEGKEEQTQYDEDGLRTVYEIYCWLEVPNDSYLKGDYTYAPYILTIDDPTSKVIALYRNWDPEEDTFEPLDWIVEWSFIPWRGAYYIGFSHLLNGISGATTGALRALLDSAHINNSPTAIKLKGAQMSGQSANINVTQIHEIDSAPGVDDIRKIAMPLPFNPPSTVLFQLLGFLIQEGKGLVKTVVEADPDYSPNIAPGTQYNQIEQGLKVYSAIHARMHDSMDRALKIQHRLNRIYLENEKPEDEDEDAKYDLMDTESNVLAYRTDYEGEMDVQPVSDPNIFSESQRFAQMGAVGQLIDKAPDLYDRRAYHKCMLQLMKVPNIDQLMPEQQGIQDENPATENIKMATGQPAGVLPDQDHLAHIQVHMDFMNSELFGKNPAIRPRFSAQWLEHMIQHMLMLYGSELKDLIEKASGQKMKNMLDESQEVRDALSKAVAAASPYAISTATKLLEKVVPVIVETMQYVQSIQPPPMMDPTQVAAQDSQQRAQIEGQKLQVKTQEIQTKAQLENQKLQAAQNEVALEQQTEKEGDILKAQVEIKKNTDDNNTALTIASMRAIEGKSTGNIKNGNALDQNFANGGLVLSDGEENE